MSIQRPVRTHTKPTYRSPWPFQLGHTSSFPFLRGDRQDAWLIELGTARWTHNEKESESSGREGDEKNADENEFSNAIVRVLKGEFAASHGVSAALTVIGGDLLKGRRGSFDGKTEV